MHHFQHWFHYINSSESWESHWNDWLLYRIIVYRWTSSRYFQNYHCYFVRLIFFAVWCNKKQLDSLMNITTKDSVFTNRSLYFAIRPHWLYLCYHFWCHYEKMLKSIVYLNVTLLLFTYYLHMERFLIRLVDQCRGFIYVLYGYAIDISKLLILIEILLYW